MTTSEAPGATGEDSAEGLLMLFVDNFAILAIRLVLACQTIGGMQKALLDQGVVSTLDPEDARELIGFTLMPDGRTWVPMAMKLGRLWLAIDYIFKSMWGCTGVELESVLGHMVHLFSVRRELMCVS